MFRDIHMNTAKGLPAGLPAGLPDVHMNTAKLDTTRTFKQGQFRLWEKELLDSPEVKRKATVAQLCERSPAPCLVLVVVATDPARPRRLPRLLLPAPGLHRLAQGPPRQVRRRYRRPRALVRRAPQGVQVVLRARARRPPQAPHEAPRRSVPHHRSGRTGRLRRGLPRPQAGDRRGMRPQEDAQTDAL